MARMAERMETALQDAPCRFPTIQIIAVCKLRISSDAIRISSKADKNHEKPMPVRTKRSREVTPESEKTIAALAIPPAIPARGRNITGRDGNKNRQPSTASNAPSRTPSRPGSARLLRVVACMMEPATPSMAPETMASARREKRKSRTITASFEAGSLFPAVNNDHKEEAAIYWLPAVSDHTATIVRQRVSVTIIASLCGKRRIEKCASLMTL
ncbi:hypothetical protein D3C87_1333280 [compost metagenome]